MTDIADMPPARHIELPGGAWLNVHEQGGDGPPFLLLHGFTDCAQSYRLLVPHLAGRHLVIPDLRGHGASFRGPIHHLDDLCLDIEEMADRMQLCAPILVGHSMGSLVAVRLAVRGKLGPKALVILSGSLTPASVALEQMTRDIAALPHPLPTDHPFFGAWHACQRQIPDAFLAPLRSACAAMRPEDWAACLKILRTTDLRKSAQTISVESLVIGGAEDPIFPEKHQATISFFLPKQRRITLEKVGHNPHWEVPQFVGELVMNIGMQ